MNTIIKLIINTTNKETNTIIMMSTSISSCVESSDYMLAVIFPEFLELFVKAFLSELF